jgi:hypothetical protein
MILRKCWILLFLWITIANSFGEPLTNIGRSDISSVKRTSSVQNSFAHKSLYYGFNKPFNTAWLISDIVSGIHYDPNNFLKKLQVLHPSYAHSLLIKSLYPFLNKAYHSNMIMLIQAFFCKFQI